MFNRFFLSKSPLNVCFDYIQLIKSLIYCEQHCVLSWQVSANVLQIFMG